MAMFVFYIVGYILTFVLIFLANRLPSSLNILFDEKISLKNGLKLSGFSWAMLIVFIFLFISNFLILLLIWILSTDIVQMIMERITNLDFNFDLKKKWIQFGEYFKNERS